MCGGRRSLPPPHMMVLHYKQDQFTKQPCQLKFSRSPLLSYTKLHAFIDMGSHWYVCMYLDMYGHITISISSLSLLSAFEFQGADEKSPGPGYDWRGFW